MYVAIILSSNKTTVSVATGNVEYHPLYLSIRNIHNSVQWGHRNTVIPIGFLAIPKCMWSLFYEMSPSFKGRYPADHKYDDDPIFRTFKKQLYHQSIATILQSLKSAMSQPVVCRCPDGHFCRVSYDLGSFIADYPEQVLLLGIVSGWCAKYVMWYCCLSWEYELTLF